MITIPEVNWLSIFPELILAVGAAVILLVEVQWKPKTWVLGVITSWLLFLAAGVTLIQWLRVYDVPATSQAWFGELIAFSGMIVMDGFTVYGRFALLVVTAVGLLAGWKLIESLGRRHAEAIALILLSTAGFSLLIASKNLVMMFLGLEIGSIALYVLAGLTTKRLTSDEAAMKYFLMGSFASALLIYGVALLYAGTGHFEILQIRAHFAQFLITSPTIIVIGLGLIIVGLGFKVSAAPFHSWAPDVYQGAPAGFVGYMAAVAKVAGFMVLARLFVVGLDGFAYSWVPVVAAISALSMVVGSLAALIQTDVRRMLAYSGVAHAGFIMTGLVGGETTGVLFYVAIYSVQLVGAFAVVSAVSGHGGSSSPISDFRGLVSVSPGLAHGFTILLLGMAGLPLTAGFIAKFGVLSEAWGSGQEWLVYVGVLASVIALAVYLRLIVTMYMEEREGESLSVPRTAGWVLGFAVLVTVAMGIFPGPLVDIAANAFSL